MGASSGTGGCSKTVLRVPSGLGAGKHGQDRVDASEDSPHTLAKDERDDCCQVNDLQVFAVQFYTNPEHLHSKLYVRLLSDHNYPTVHVASLHSRTWESRSRILSKCLFEGGNVAHPSIVSSTGSTCTRLP